MTPSELTTSAILDQLDSCAAAYTFPMLDNAYIFPAAARLTLYRDATRWVMVVEALGFSPKAGQDAERIILDLYGFGNCLRQPPGFLASLSPATAHQPLFEDPWPGKLVAEAPSLLLRGHEVPVPTEPAIYASAGIERRSPDVIWGFEMLRALLPKYRALLLATEPERRTHIPAKLPELIQLDDWHHPDLADDELPSHTETFRQLAAVLNTGDLAQYAPTEPPNTHWRHWIHGGDGVTAPASTMC